MFNKKISTPIALLIIVVAAALAGGVFYWQFDKVKEMKSPEIINLTEKVKNSTSSIASNCAEQGEQIDFVDESFPKECCEGLEDVLSPDSVSVADECYYSGTQSGVHWGYCSDCGNGICEERESVCGCPEDCVGKGESDFETVQNFCEDEYGYEYYCIGPTGEETKMELELCNLCK